MAIANEKTAPSSKASHPRMVALPLSRHMESSHPTVTQATLDHTRTRKYSALGSTMCVNASELTSPSVGAKNRQCSPISPSIERNVVARAANRRVIPPTRFAKLRNHSVAIQRSTICPAISGDTIHPNGYIA